MWFVTHRLTFKLCIYITTYEGVDEVLKKLSLCRISHVIVAYLLLMLKLDSFSCQLQKRKSQLMRTDVRLWTDCPYRVHMAMLFRLRELWNFVAFFTYYLLMCYSYGSCKVAFDILSIFVSIYVFYVYFNGCIESVKEISFLVPQILYEHIISSFLFHSMYDLMVFNEKTFIGSIQDLMLQRLFHCL